jgi:hypothetical protein
MSAEWSAEGATAGDAKIIVGDTAELDLELARDLGRRYLRRISPYSRVLHRRYFRGPNTHLRAGHKAINIREFEEARKHWKTASESPRAKAQAKAWHNLAVIQENKGNMQRAVSLSTKASKVLSPVWVSMYTDELQERMDRLSRLEAQMAAPAPKLAPPAEVVETPGLNPEGQESGAAVKPDAPDAPE